MRLRLLRYLSAVYSGEVEQMYQALSEILIPSDRTDMAAFLGLRDTDHVYEERAADPDSTLFGIDRAEHGHARVRMPR